MGPWAPEPMRLVRRPLHTLAMPWLGRGWGFAAITYSAHWGAARATADSQQPEPERQPTASSQSDSRQPERSARSHGQPERGVSSLSKRQRPDQWHSAQAPANASQHVSCSKLGLRGPAGHCPSLAPPRSQPCSLLADAPIVAAQRAVGAAAQGAVVAVHRTVVVAVAVHSTVAAHRAVGARGPKGRSGPGTCLTIAWSRPLLATCALRSCGKICRRTSIQRSP